MSTSPSPSSSFSSPSASNSHPTVLPWDYTASSPAVGTLLPVSSSPSTSTSTSPSPSSPSSSLPALFRPLSLRSLTLKNRIAVSPMCQYTSPDGFLTDWHLVHLGQYAVGGVGFVIQEATAVQENGRISPYCAGLWKDEHMEQQKRIVTFIHSQQTATGIQLAHAGRKASTRAPFHMVNGKKDYCPPTAADKGWTNVVGPSPLPFDVDWCVPLEMSVSDIHQLTADFVAATIRSEKVGFDYVEIHAAHGYALSEFLSPLANQRTDSYGGSFENRIRFLLEVTKAVRAVWPATKPLGVRISCVEWVEGGWSMDDTMRLIPHLIALGVDLIDCSSGGMTVTQQITAGPGFQVPFASAVSDKYRGQIVVSAVGVITEPKQANDIVEQGQADMVMLAREFLRNPYWAQQAARELGVDVAVAPQYMYGKRPIPKPAAL